MRLRIDREAGASEAPELNNSVLKSVLVATLSPLGAYAVLLLLWPFVSPYVWLMFFPAVLIAAWLGGFLSGIGATLLSTMLAWWRFIPIEGNFRVPAARFYLSPIMF